MRYYIFCGGGGGGIENQHTPPDKLISFKGRPFDLISINIYLGDLVKWVGTTPGTRIRILQRNNRKRVVAGYTQWLSNGKGRQVNLLKFGLEFGGRVVSEEGGTLGDKVKGVLLGEPLARE